MDVGELGCPPERKYQMEAQEGPGASRGEDPLLGQDLRGGMREALQGSFSPLGRTG